MVRVAMCREGRMRCRVGGSEDSEGRTEGSRG